MLLFQIFAAIVRLFIRALLAIILYPMWIVVIIISSPLRIFSARAHQTVAHKFFDMSLYIVFMGKRGY